MEKYSTDELQRLLSSNLELTNDELYHYFGAENETDYATIRKAKSIFLKSVNAYLESRGKPETAEGMKVFIESLKSDDAVSSKQITTSVLLDDKVHKVLLSTAKRLGRSNSYLVNAILKKALL